MKIFDENEIWRPVAHFESMYEVSDRGRVRSCRASLSIHEEVSKGPMRKFFVTGKHCLATNKFIYDGISKNHVTRLKNGARWISTNEKINTLRHQLKGMSNNAIKL